MKYVKWIFVVIVISSLTSFIVKDKPNKGLNPGDSAPDFNFSSLLKKENIELKTFKGQYVLLSFWASYDAESRLQNAALNNALRVSDYENVKMISVSFDQYQSVFEETARMDNLSAEICAVDVNGSKSKLFKAFRLNKGFSNFLLDANGIILARDISPSTLSDLIEPRKF